MADQVTGGLDQVGQEPIIQGKPATAPKGARYALPVTPATGVLPGTILEDMERIYQQKVAAQNPFLEYVKDVLAWGGTEKPGTTMETVRRRAQDKEEREAELFRMRSDIASARAQQQQLANQAQYLKGVVGEGGAPGQAAPGVAGLGQLPSDVAKAIRDKMNLGDVAGAQAILDNYNKTKMTEDIKFLTNPSTYNKTVEIVLPDGRIQIVDPLTARRMVETGQGDIVPPAAPAPRPAAATPAPAPVAPAVAAPAPTPVTPTAPTAAAPAAAVKTSGEFKYEDLTESQIAGLERQMLSMGLDPRDVLRRAGAAEDFNKRPLDVRRRLFAAADEGAQAKTDVIPTSAQAPAAPAAPQAPVQVAQAPKPGATLPEARAALELRKKELEGMSAADVKEYETKFIPSTDLGSIADRKSVATEIIDLAQNNPSVIGILQTPGIGSAIATLIESGISISGGHSIGIKEIDDAIFKGRKATKPEDIAARERLKTLLEKTAFAQSALLKGQGQVTEFERTLLQRISGSIKSTPENVIKIQKALLERAKYDETLGNLFAQQRKAGKTYSEFKASPEYQAAYKNYINALTAIEKEKIEFPKAQAPGAPRSGTAPGGIKWRVVP